jgi:subtilase family serine protease
VNGDRANITVMGYLIQSGTGYVENTKEVNPQLYWQAVTTGNQGISEANLYDASNIRVRNVQLSYDLFLKTFYRA